jgi:transcription antitermination factor NusG
VNDPGTAPIEFSPRDRVRLRYGMFQGAVGEVIGPDPERSGNWQVRLRVRGREVEVSLAGWTLEPAG